MKPMVERRPGFQNANMLMQFIVLTQQIAHRIYQE
jgi:hypothetical protein